MLSWVNAGGSWCARLCIKSLRRLRLSRACSPELWERLAWMVTLWRSSVPISSDCSPSMWSSWEESLMKRLLSGAFKRSQSTKISSNWAKLNLNQTANPNSNNLSANTPKFSFKLLCSNFQSKGKTTSWAPCLKWEQKAKKVLYSLNSTQQSSVWKHASKFLNRNWPEVSWMRGPLSK